MDCNHQLCGCLTVRSYTVVQPVWFGFSICKMEIIRLLLYGATVQSEGKKYKKAKGKKAKGKGYAFVAFQGKPPPSQDTLASVFLRLLFLLQYLATHS